MNILGVLISGIFDQMGAIGEVNLLSFLFIHRFIFLSVAFFIVYGLSVSIAPLLYLSRKRRSSVTVDCHNTHAHIQIWLNDLS